MKTSTWYPVAIFYPPLKYIGGCVWLFLQSWKGNAYFTESAERVEYGKWVVVIFPGRGPVGCRWNRFPERFARNVWHWRSLIQSDRFTWDVLRRRRESAQMTPETWSNGGYMIVVWIARNLWFHNVLILTWNCKFGVRLDDGVVICLTALKCKSGFWKLRQRCWSC